MVNVLTMGQIYEFLLYGCLISASIFFVLFGVSNVVKAVTPTEKVDDCHWLTVCLSVVTKVVVVAVQAFAYSFIMFVLISTLTVMGWFPFGV